MTDRPKVWRNGQLVPWCDARAPLLSHGFSRGAVVFEVFGVHASQRGPAAFRMDEHLGRLARSLELLGMESAYSMDEITAAVSSTVAANAMGRGLVKILAYWGAEATIRLVPDGPVDVAIFTVPDSPDLGLDSVEPTSACVSRWRKLHPDSVPVEAKVSAHYLNGYLARKDAEDRGFGIGLLLDADGNLAEGSTESVFVVRDGILGSPPAEGRILRSITRLSILQAARIVGIPVREAPVSLEELLAADEVFTANSAVKTLPIARLEDRELDAPGPVTRRVMAMLDDITSFRDERFAGWFQYL